MAEQAAVPCKLQKNDLAPDLALVQVGGLESPYSSCHSGLGCFFQARYYAET